MRRDIKKLIGVFALLLVLPVGILALKYAPFGIRSRAVFPDTPIINSTILLSNLSSTSVTLSWFTGVVTEGKVYYGTAESNLNISAADNFPGYNKKNGSILHSVILNDLTPDTDYYFKICHGDGCNSNVFYGKGFDNVKGVLTRITFIPPKALISRFPSIITSRTPFKKPSIAVSVTPGRSISPTIPVTATIMPSVTGSPSSVLLSHNVLKASVPFSFHTPVVLPVPDIPMPFYGKMTTSGVMNQTALAVYSLKRGAVFSAPLSTTVNITGNLTNFDIELSNAKKNDFRESFGYPEGLKNSDIITVKIYYLVNGILTEKIKSLSIDPVDLKPVELKY